MADIKKEYERWLANATIDADVAAELKTLDDTKIEDAFYRDLAFGTGGLRGVIGAGTNRMNIYTVAKASQGLADYLKKNFEMPSVAIGYDSRIKSDVFAKVAAGVFAANGVKVNIWPVLMPVPTVSFATRYLHTSAGVMVTASHNPSKYNGYKVYGADGCQITTEVAAEILAEIEKLDIFADVKTSDFEAGVANGSIQYIPDEVYTAFVEQVKSQSVLFGEEVNKNVAIVYSPLNGTGLKPVTRTLKEMGYTNITVVKEQEQPDGNFPTCPYPNPEIKEAMALGIQIISYIVDTLNLDVLLLAHVIHVSDSNDKIIIDELMKRLDRRYRSRVHVVDHLIQPYEARILLGGGKATITGRMHAAVSSINMGTVPICLSYSVKFKGVIGDDFDLNDYIYQCRGDDIWASGNVHVEVIKRLNAVLENRESILNNIASKLEAVKKKSMLQIEELF